MGEALLQMAAPRDARKAAAPALSTSISRPHDGRPSAAQQTCPGKLPIEYAIINQCAPSSRPRPQQPVTALDTFQLKRARDAMCGSATAGREPTVFESMDLPAWDDEEPMAVYMAAARPPQQLRPHAMDAAIEEALDMASADRARGRNHTGVRAWFAFHHREGTTANRPIDPNAPLWAKLQEEWKAMRFVCALIEERGITVRSAANYFSAVQGWHAREHGVKLAGGIKLERLPQMLKGLRRKHGDPARKLRRGVSARALRKGMDCLYPRADPANANMRAALAVAFQGLLRSQEFAHDPRKAWDPKRNLTRADLKELSSTVARFDLFVCKSHEFLASKSTTLVIGAGGTFIDAVEELHNLLRVDPLRRGESAAHTPMFRHAGTSQPLLVDDIMLAVRNIMRLAGEDPAEYGTHSLRIGGATALFAAGADMTVIRTMGRWSSDIYQLYVRACLERCCLWSKRAGSVEVTDLEGTIDEVDYY